MLTFQDLTEEDRNWLNGKIDELIGDERDSLEYDCIDNRRLARLGEIEEEWEYEDARRNGCCGAADFRFEGAPSGATYLYGFNYGH
jgi:hypothetical protein